MDGKSVIVGAIIVCLLIAGVGYYGYSQGWFGGGGGGGGEQPFAGTGTIIEETFNLSKGGHKAVKFETTKETEVYWEWNSNRDINFYLLTEEEYNNWKAGESFNYIHRRKVRDSGSYRVTLNPGKYVLVWNSPYGNAEVNAKAVLG